MEQLLSNREIANDLQVPLKLVSKLRQKNFNESIDILREISNNREYFMQHKGDIEKIEDEFCRIFSRNNPYLPATPADMRQSFDETIARFIEQIGSQLLIKDMREAGKNKKDIRSIVYFFFVKPGHISRWETLVRAHGKQSFFEPQWVIDTRVEFKKMQADLMGKRDLAERKKMVAEMNRLKKQLAAKGYSL